MVTVGSICCTTCNSAIPESTGICPKCQKWRHVYINVYWARKIGGDGGHYQIRKDETGKALEYGTAYNLRKQIQTEILAHTFKPYRYISSERNPNRCELWYPKWLAAVRAEKAPGTYLSYESSVKAHFGFWDKKDLGGIQKKDVKGWLKTLSMRKDSLRTIRNRFHSFLSWIAEETDIIETIPHFPKIEGRDEKEKFAITLDQQFAAADKLSPVMRRAVLVMMLTAMRPSEALVLKRSDIDSEKSEVRIRRTWSGREIRETTKTGEPRTVPLPKIALEIVKEALGDRIGDVWLFPRRDGLLPYREKDVSREWKTRVGLPATLRDATRRSCVTILKDGGMDMRGLQELLGHKALTTTEIYVGKDATRLKGQMDEIQGKVINFRNQTETTFEK